MEMFPLLLQLALLLFSVALSLYLSTISCPIALIVIGLTSIGTLAYMFQLVSAAVYQDSPFQTPLASVLRRLAMGLWKTLLDLPAFLRQFLQGLSDTWKAIRKFLQQDLITLPLPLSFFPSTLSVNQSTLSYELDDKESTPNPLSAAPSLEASPAIPAVMWLLETSTNPDVISGAADLAVDLQWPLDADLDVALHRLRDTFWASFVVTDDIFNTQFRVQDGSIQHAIACGQAYGTMSISSRGNHKLLKSRATLVLTGAEGTQSLHLAQLHTVFKALKGGTGCLQTVRTQPDMLWVLHVLPHTAWKSADFASCLKSMLDYATTSWAGLTNFAIDFLVEELFKNLGKSLDEKSTDLTTAKEIITVANQMVKMAGHTLDYIDGEQIVRKQVYDLCATIARVDGWVDVIVAALAFGDLYGPAVLKDVAWVYAALQNGQPSSDGLQNDWDTAAEERVLQLLKALNNANWGFPAPSTKVLQVILKALSTEGPCSIEALKLLCLKKKWFIDNDFELVMQEHNVWSQMGVIIMKNSLQMSVAYILLGAMLSEKIQWRPYIHHNLSH
ncbi:hypothetical protein C8J57DRAFT_1242927 [Mycena rebaudengoi]|nr:hypothetical protein C8J57DRAFT_1242927 [Mycena rebaudengoi]